jgi:hypothetical protein
MPSPVSYPDRSTGLIIFGILEIALGGLCALMIPFMLLGAVFSRKAMGGPMPAGTYVAGICSYSFAAAILVALGIGSIQARRWARALNLIAAVVGLIMGSIMTVFLTIAMPSGFMAGMHQAAANTPNAPPLSTAATAIILTLIIIFFSFFFVAVPLAFLLFFSRKTVEETCKWRDPVERWTDRCPLPVLAVSLLLGFGAAYCLLTALTTPIATLFGKYVTGWPAAVLLVGVAVLQGFLAFALYRLSLAGWWTTFITMALRLISETITYAHADLLKAYSKMGWSQTRLDFMNANPTFHRGGFLWFGVAISFIFMMYLLWTKRYFRDVATPEQANAPPPPHLSSPPSF